MWLVVLRFLEFVRGSSGEVLTLLQGTDAKIGNPNPKKSHREKSPPPPLITTSSDHQWLPPRVPDSINSLYSLSKSLDTKGAEYGANKHKRV